MMKRLTREMDAWVRRTLMELDMARRRINCMCHTERLLHGRSAAEGKLSRRAKNVAKAYAQLRSVLDACRENPTDEMLDQLERTDMSALGVLHRMANAQHGYIFGSGMFAPDAHSTWHDRTFTDTVMDLMWTDEYGLDVIMDEVEAVARAEAAGDV